MNIELKRKLLHIIVFDRERQTQKIIFHNSSFPNKAFQEDVKKYDIKVSAYKIENDRELLICKDVSPIGLRDELKEFKKIKLAFTGITPENNESKIDLSDFKLNSKIWRLVF